MSAASPVKSVTDKLDPNRTYTVDAVKDGQYFTDRGLTAAEVEIGKINLPAHGFTILAIVDEKHEFSASDLAAFGTKAFAQ